MPHLFMVSLGPVQDFIASARRSRDLWFSSWMLSELSKAAAAAIVKLEGGDTGCLIFPAPDPTGKRFELVPGSQFNVANKVLARVTTPPLSVGKAVLTAVQERLETLKLRTLKKIRLEGELLNRANKQVAGLPEVYWAALPLDSGDRYDQVRERLEAVMQARKLTRNFKASEWGAATPKSSLDGQRESVIPENDYQDVREGRLTEKELFRRYGVRPGERLCGVGLLKRHGRVARDERLYPHEDLPEFYDHLIFSTSHYAAFPVIQRMLARYTEESSIKPRIGRFIDTLKAFGMADDQLQELPESDPRRRRYRFWTYDGRILFGSRYPELLGISTHVVKEKETLDRALTALRDLLKDVAALNGEPLPYYALLHADGDRMGKVIERYTTIEEHQDLSRTLARFAGQAREIVEAHDGRLIYSGGDDVLAFLPLHTAINCVDQLADRFYTLLRGFTDSEDQSPTLSSGLAVVHFLEPLSAALELARNAEKRAKGLPDKHGLAITLSKRGGGDRTVCDARSTLIQRLRTLTQLHRDGAIPDGLAYELEAISIRLEPDGPVPDCPRCNGQRDTASPLPIEVPLTCPRCRLRRLQVIEARRIFKRKMAGGGSRAVADEHLRQLEDLLPPEPERSPVPPLQSLLDSLIISAMLARAEGIAYPEQDEPSTPRSQEAT